jgi:glycosyltransferase involved in cell wall biosynthesis
MSAERPLVSVLMASYNAEAWIAETIESVLGQTYPNVELVIADDASSDVSREIVRGFGSDRVRLLEFDERAGPTRRRNDALRAAAGPLLAWLDHDDVWLPEKLDKQVAVLEQRPEVGLVYSGYEAFDSATGQLVPWRDESLESEGDILTDLFVKGCFIASLTTVFRREGLERRGVAFQEADFAFGDDYYLWLVLSLDWQVARVDEVLARYRRHESNESSRLTGTNYHLTRIQLLREFLHDFPEARERLGDDVGVGLAAHYLHAAGFEFKRGNRMRGRQLVLRAFAASPRETLAAIRQG